MHITYERKGVSFIGRGRKRGLKTDVRRNVEIKNVYWLEKGIFFSISIVLYVH